MRLPVNVDYHEHLGCGLILDESLGERKIHRDSAGNRTWDLPITSWTLLPLSYWTHGRGAEVSWPIMAILEPSADSSCLSLPHRHLVCN